MKTNTQTLLKRFFSILITKWSTFRHIQFILFLLSKFPIKVTASWKSIEEFVKEKDAKFPGKGKRIFNPNHCKINTGEIELKEKMFILLEFFATPFEEGPSIYDQGFKTKVLALTKKRIITVLVKYHNSPDNDDSTIIHEVASSVIVKQYSKKHVNKEIKNSFKQFHESQNGNKKLAGQEVLDALIEEISKLNFKKSSKKIFKLHGEFIKIKEELN